MTNSTWTQEDEAAFNELSERRKRAHEEAMRPIDNMIATKWPFPAVSMTLPLQHQLARFMVDNATLLRKILRPFDGTCGDVRPATIEELDGARLHKLMLWSRVFSIRPNDDFRNLVETITFHRAPHMPKADEAHVASIRRLIDSLPSE